MIFELYWRWYEDYCPQLFEGPNKTEKEWKEDCAKALVNVGDKYIEKETGWVSVPRWIDEAVKELEKMGYKRMNPIGWGFFGGYILQDDEYDDDDKIWEKVVGKRLYDKAIEKNKLYEKRLHGKREKDEKRQKRRS